jgi:hypothetical protein
MTATLDDTTLHIERTIEIDAPPDVVFASLLEQIGPGNERPDGVAMPMTIEPRPGGRWFRDLGDDAGHLWGHVQVIKSPTLLEINGPLFMSYPALSHLQYRIEAAGSGSRLHFTHRALGVIEPEHREGVKSGWDFLLARTKERAERH